MNQDQQWVLTKYDQWDKKKAKKLKKELLQQEHYKQIAYKQNCNDDGDEFGNDNNELDDLDDDIKSRSTNDNNSTIKRLLLANESLARSMKKKADDRSLLEIAKIYVTMGKQAEADKLIQKVLNPSNDDAISNNNNTNMSVAYNTTFDKTIDDDESEDTNNNKTIDDDEIKEMNNNKMDNKKIAEEIESSSDDDMLNYAINTTKKDDNTHDDNIEKEKNSLSDDNNYGAVMQYNA